MSIHRALLPAVLIPALVLGLWACAQTREAAQGDSAALFPHPEDFAHDHSVAAEDLNSCLTCHDLEQTVDMISGASGLPGTTDTALPEPGPVPTCRSCHDVYPHEIDLLAEHGTAWEADVSACTMCHGSAGDKNPSANPADTCTGCHATYPHPSNWSSAKEHGAELLVRGAATACLGCHEADSCDSCHSGYPHPEDYTWSHGPDYSEGSCGGNCHDGAQEGAPGEVLCSDCHDEELP